MSRLIQSRPFDIRQHRAVSPVPRQSVRLRVTAGGFLPRDRCRHGKSRFDTIRRGTINAAAQTLYALDRNTIGALPAIFAPSVTGEVSGVDNFRLARGVFNDGRPSRQRGGAHMGDGRADADTLSITICAPLRRPSTEAFAALFQLMIRAVVPDR